MVAKREKIKKIKDKGRQRADEVRDRIGRFQSVNARLTIIIVAMIVVVAVGLTLTSVLMSTAGLKKNIDDSMQQLALQTSTKIESDLNGIVQGMKSFALNRELWDVKSNEAEIKKLLAEFAELNGHDYAYITASDGIGYTSQDNPTNITERAYFPIVMGGDIYINEPTLSVSTGKLVILFVVPIVNEQGEVIGVLGAGRDGMSLTEMIADVTYAETGNAFMLGRTGTLIASGKTDLVVEGFNIVEAAETNPEYESMMPQTLAMIAGETGIDNFRFMGNNMQAAYAPIQLAGWSVAVQAPMDEAYASMYNMRYVLIFSAVAAFVISILLSSFFIRRVSKPISEAAGYIKQLSLGHTDINIDQKIKERKDEIGLLTRAVDEISGSIEEKSQAAESIARGDLSVSVTPRSEYDVLSLSMQKMIDSLNEMNAESQMLTRAAAQGQLLTRGDADKFSGAYKDIVAGINATLEAITTPVSEAQEIMALLAKNDYTRSMDGDYQGMVLEFADSVNTVRERLLSIQGAMVDVANGDFGSYKEFAAIGRLSENDQLMPALISMMEAVMKLADEAGKIATAAAEGDLSYRGDTGVLSGSYAEVVEALNNALDNIAQPIDAVSSVLRLMAEGDLSTRMTGDFKGSYAEMQNAINSSLESLYQLVSEIATAADQVKMGAAQIADGSQVLSQGSTEQASSVEELSASLTQIAAQTRQNAGNASQARQMAEKANNDAAQGNTQMDEMVEAMKQINEASANIAKIIKVIDDIAFQTNILALNAAVEAARAGQHGKGFAVVAEEVRNLAARSAEAARETTEYIETTLNRVEGGSKIASSTAESLTSIVEGVQQVAQLVEDIATASNEQASGIAQINQGIDQVSKVVQSNSATAEESAAASEELQQQAQMLNESVNQFKL